jgi:AcrR family transcriptional regulator
VTAPAAGASPAGAASGDASEPARRRGRRPSGEDTRGAILVAARDEFAERGYDGTTLRGIARAAGVDPRLVHHYFDGKEEIFVAAMDFPVRPPELVAALLAAGPDGIGERMVRNVLAVWDHPEARARVIGLLSAAVAGEAGARMIRQFITRELVGRIAAALDVDQPELRTELAASHLVGLAMARVVIRVEPLASADAEEIVRIVGPTIQRYLTGDL